MGVISPSSLPKRYRFISVFVDDFSRFAMAYPIKNKNQGTELTGGSTQKVLDSLGAELQLSCLDTPELNGTPKSLNKTIQMKVRAPMYDSGLPEKMWDLALNAAVFAYNCTPHHSNNMEIPLAKLVPNKRIDISQMRRFGCIYYMRVQRNTKTKFQAKEKRAFMVDYTPTGYRLLCPDEGKFYESRDVKFNERFVYGDINGKGSIKNWDNVTVDIKLDEWFLIFEKEREEMTTSEREPPDVRRKSGRPKKSTALEANMADTNLKCKNPVRDVSFAGLAIADDLIKNLTFKKYDTDMADKDTSAEDLTHYLLLAGINKDPSSYKEAIKAADREDRPVGLINGRRPNIIDSCWVLKKKIDTQGQNNTRNLCPGVKTDLDQNGSSSGLNCIDQERQNKVCKLQRALYGLEVSPKKWHDRFSEAAIKIDLKLHILEPNDPNRLKFVKESLLSEFGMTDLGEVEAFLGIEVRRGRERQINPTDEDWNMIKIVFRYLAGTKSFGLQFLGRHDNLEAFSDASFGDSKGSLTTSGYVIKLFRDAAAWRTHKQTYVALSTCQAAYVALSEVCKELIAVDNCLTIILNKTFCPADLWCDNKAAELNSKISGSEKLGHMTEIHEHYVKECVTYGRVNISGNDQADTAPTSLSTLEAQETQQPLALEHHVEGYPRALNKAMTMLCCLLRLKPYLQDGLLRVGGRLSHSLFDEDAKHPLVLKFQDHLPSLLIGDHGSNLVGASRELRQLWKGLKGLRVFSEELLKLNTKWHFNTPSAPHFGGLWEAAVKSCKFHLKRITDSKLSAGIFDRPETCSLFKDEIFERTIKDNKKAAWSCFKDVLTKFLGNTKEVSYKIIVKNLNNGTLLKSKEKGFTKT
ncbi:uncharacterized protein LOC106637466 [Copidosoma floridanum]|uniref:uncharacterized protein LOC106637466 n=1 Tax=Copidosoma floridanum TaxID=29053 RepID=UPI0006C97325|nr:uncharacterized protein LOC106637466 [Copidosoma floridanum]